MSKKCHISPSSRINCYFFAIIVAFIHFLVTNHTTQFASKYAVQTLLSHWITKFAPQYLVTDRCTEFIYQGMEHHCSLFDIDNTSRTPYSSWTSSLIEVQNSNLGIHFRLFSQNLPTNWSIQTQMNTYAHNTTHLSKFRVSSGQNAFHTHLSLLIYHVTFLKMVLARIEIHLLNTHIIGITKFQFFCPFPQ